MEDPDEAIVLFREGSDPCPPGHPGRSMSLNTLAICLSTRRDQLGTVEDLEEAIVLGREALDLRPQGHPGRSTSLKNLAVRLSTRFMQCGGIEDLNEAITLGREALSLRPRGHPLRSSSLNILAFCLSARYERLGETADLNEAIVLDREALDLCHPGHSLRSTPLICLAVDLSTRHDQLGAIEDLNEAIALDREALELCSPGHNNRSLSFSNIAVHLFSRYRQVGAVEDLDEAVSFAQGGLALCTQGHPYRSHSLDHISRYLRTRFIQLRLVEDKEVQFSPCAHLVDEPRAVSPSDLSAPRAWIRVVEDLQQPTTPLAYETSLQLLIQHLATLPSLPQHLVVLESLTSSLAVDAFSACLRNRALTRAIELLEQGRGVFWNQLTRLRSPLDDVIASGPTGKLLANKFTQISSLIRNILDSPGVNQHEQACRLNVELERVVTRIRELPGLSRFLLPSLFSDLRHAACGGPVIIVNASKYSCDALIVLLDQDPVHIPLQTTRENVRDLSMELHTLTVRAKRFNVTRELASVLRKVWDKIVFPITNLLQTIHPPQSRIWWCPTDEFTALPLHAAGPYRKGQRNLVDLYISSYTPTLTALIHARRHNSLHSTSEGKRFIAIGQAKAKGENELLSVGAELTNVGQRVDSLATFTRIEGAESCISRVAEEFRRNEWVHLACHGIPNRNQPFKSAFALYDGHFTIEHIIRCQLGNPQFAYLSACQTTVGDEKSPDEVIHLASAMQFAGFRSVIGTMWAVDDGETSKITSTFYKYMVNESGRLEHTRAAFALNETMKSVNVPFDQRILYIHLGA